VRSRRVLVVLVASGLLSGCSTSVSGHGVAGTTTSPVASLSPSSGAGSSAPTATDSSTATRGPAVVVATDLPLQGASASASRATNQAIALYLKSVGYRAGRFSVTLRTYDDSAASTGAWDSATCARNAVRHGGNLRELAVMGTYNSGCAKIEVPILNQAPGGPVLMVSHSNTNPGLTSSWEPGDPNRYYPTGQRSYARVIATDADQGTAAARYAASTLHVRRCVVLDDGESYGAGVAKRFRSEAERQSITIVATATWNAQQASYRDLFGKVAAQHPDCVYLGGIYDNNGARLLADKVAVLGDNTKTKLLGPDGFTGWPDMDANPNAAGMYMTVDGLSTATIAARGGAAARFIHGYEARYGEIPSYLVTYGVAAIQVILAAIAKSDGTRRGVTNAVFTGAGITIPAAQSVLGSQIKIDPRAGDTLDRELTILRLTGGAERAVQSVRVS
jgi:branched-chain amino acid transport system substrate-binding protein